MKPLITLIQTAITITTSDALLTGFNVAAQLPSGVCRSQNDWELAFQRLSSFSDHATKARLFTSSHCNTLVNAVPAAIKTNISLLVGIWTEDSFYFNAEKAALLQAIEEYGSDWLHATNVGSENLQRNGTTPQVLANQIHDVRNVLMEVGVHKPVGHVDTWAAWADPANEAVVDAVDFLGNEFVPRWQLIGVETGFVGNTYWRGIGNAQHLTYGREAWTTTTGQLIADTIKWNDAQGTGVPQTY